MDVSQVRKGQPAVGERVGPEQVEVDEQDVELYGERRAAHRKSQPLRTSPAQKVGTSRTVTDTGSSPGSILYMIF